MNKNETTNDLEKSVVIEIPRNTLDEMIEKKIILNSIYGKFIVLVMVKSLNARKIIVVMNVKKMII